MRHNILFCCLFFLVSMGTAFSQGITGSVYNEEGKPLIGAHVRIDVLKMIKTTDHEGKFIFSEVPSGKMEVKASYVGYRSQNKTIRIKEEGINEIIFCMLPKSSDLSEIVVIATERNNHYSTEISRPYLDRTQALDLKDIFSSEPAIAISGGGQNAQRIYLRGVEGSNLNITIDGAKQGRNLFQHRGNAGVLDPALLKRVRVSTGADALKTSGGLAGSIAFETIDPQDIISDQRKVGGSVSTGFSGVSNRYNARALIGGKLNQYTGLLFSASWDDQNDYRTAKTGLISYTGGKTQNYFAKLSILDYKYHELRLNTTYNRTSGHYITGGAGSDMGIPSDTLTAQYQVSSRNTHSLDYRFLPDNQFVKLFVNGFYNHRNLENKGSSIDVTSNNLGGSIKNELQFQIYHLQNFFVIGADYDKEDAKSASAISDEGSIRTNTSSTWGVFAQGKSVIYMFSASYGIRRDDYKSDFGPHLLKGDRFSPNVGFNIEPLRGLQLYTSYGKAIRAGGIIPIQWMSNITEKTNVNNGKPLKPETSEMKDVGITYHKRSLFTSHDRLTVRAKLFSTKMNNLIERIDGGGGLVSDIRNDSLGVNLKGYELSLGWETSEIQTRLSFVHVNMENSKGESLAITRRKIAPMGDRFNWDISWQANSEIMVGYTFNAVKRLKKVASFERPGYALHNIQAQWKPKSISGLAVSFVVNNLLNKQYSEQTSIDRGGEIVPEQGRDTRVSLTYKF